MNLSILIKNHIPFIPQANLADYTTFKLGGPCVALVTCSNAEQLTHTTAILRSMNMPFILMGFGSNILVSDQGIQSVVVRYTCETPNIQRYDNCLSVDAATQLDSLAEFAVNAGLEGLTTFSGIPGTIGGAIAGNAGAYGTQITDKLTKLTILKPDNSITVTPKSALHFTYRDSEFKNNQDIVLRAEFELSPENAATLQKDRHDIISTRKSKHGHWQDTPCAGSFFRNVEPTSQAGPRQSAGWFIEQAGAKGLYFGGAHPYHKHANIITRDEGASAQDVYDLTNKIMEMVNEKFAIQLIREVRLLGSFNGSEIPQGFW